MLMLYLFRAFHTCAHARQTVKRLQDFPIIAWELQPVRLSKLYSIRNLTCGTRQQSAIVRLSPWLYFPCLGCSIFSSRSNL